MWRRLLPRKPNKRQTEPSPGPPEKVEKATEEPPLIDPEPQPGPSRLSPPISRSGSARRKNKPRKLEIVSDEDILMLKRNITLSELLLRSEPLFVDTELPSEIDRDLQEILQEPSQERELEPLQEWLSLRERSQQPLEEWSQQSYQARSRQPLQERSQQSLRARSQQPFRARSQQSFPTRARGSAQPRTRRPRQPRLRGSLQARSQQPFENLQENIEQ
ncbi:unnamed protein product [Brugia pahangi]|uniref:ASXH domain-containing protein n=2 Tax=Brugia TaxID=6278 RepID=A0A0N4T5U3_BRUPA|nr:unnamed protein product [Brugia pahangi]